MSRPRLNLIELLNASFEKNAARPAYEDAQHQLDFKTLHAIALGGVRQLAHARIGKGERVAMCMQDGADFLCALLAIWLRGAVPVPVNRSQKAETVEFVLRQCDASAILVDGVVEVRSPGRRIVWRREAVPVSDAGVASVDGDDDAMVLYTSGTTGMPKGVRHSHHALALNAVEMSELLELAPEDRVFLNIPFYYSNSISHLLMAQLNGACVCAAQGFLFGNALLEAVKSAGATGFAGVPAHYVRLVDALTETQQTRLRFLMNSGDHLPVNVLKSLLERFPDADIFCVYGISECAPRVCCLDPALVESKMGSVGRPLPATRITVRDEDGRELAAGELGEIYVESECLMKEYFRNPAATARAMTAYGLRTGDMGYLDADGCLFLSGRSDSVFKSGGEKVSCRLIEETIRDSEQFASAFSDVVVAESPDHFLGKVARVYYVPRDDNPEAMKAMRRALNKTLPKSHIPREFIAIRQVERSPSGKIVKQSLLDPKNLISR